MEKENTGKRLLHPSKLGNHKVNEDSHVRAMHENRGSHAKLGRDIGLAFGTSTEKYTVLPRLLKLCHAIGGKKSARLHQFFFLVRW